MGLLDSSGDAPTVEDADLKGELKKMNKNMGRQEHGAATHELNASALPHGSVASTVGDADLKCELKKMNKNMRPMIASPLARA